MKNYLIVSHDAGGAQVLCAWVKAHTEHHYEFLLEGPAIGVFNNNLGSIDNHKRKILDTIKDFSFDVILTGTSWESNLEKQTILACTQQGQKVITHLDHWQEYVSKLTLDGARLYPNEFWASDQYAYQRAKNEFQSSKVLLVENLYFKSIVERIKQYENKFSPSKKKKLLYVTEPTSAAGLKRCQNAEYYGYTEFSALTAYLDYIHKYQDNIEEFRLRLHPAENSNKYNHIIKNSTVPIKIVSSDSSSLEIDIAWSDIVIGCETTALAIAALANKTVFTSVPATKTKIAVPFKNIKRIFPAKI